MVALAVLAGLLGCAQRPQLDRFKIHIDADGAYRVTYEDLAAAGLEGSPASAGLALSQRGQPVPIWIEDGGDGRFGPGDHLELLGEHLRGPVSNFDEHARFNVYRLDTDSEAGARMRAPTATERPTPAGVGALRAHHRLERDEIMVRFAGRRSGDAESELWFWHRLNHSDREAFEVELPIDRLPHGGDASAEVSLRLHFRGWSGATARHRTRRRSEPDQRFPDHLVKVWLNRTLIATETWWGQDEHLIEVPSLPAGSLGQERNVLRVRLPRRQDADGKTLIDAVLLNWIEVEHPHSGLLAEGQERLVWRPGDDLRPAGLTVEAAAEVRVYGEDGSRRRATLSGGRERFPLTLSTAGGTLLAVVGDALRPPAAVTADRPSSWRRHDRQTDYLIISHRSLLDSASELAEHHRRRGLRVAVIDVEDAYDEFNHGIVHPRAIRDLVAHAHRAWPTPAPRFVLLVGDASWDVRSERPDDRRYADWTFRGRDRPDFIKNKSTPYEDAGRRRDLVPTWRHQSAQGHAASDNYFVAVEGGDERPDLAIGRLPAATPDEARTMVDKILRYAADGPTGAWRRRILWITNEQDGFKRRTDILAAAAGEEGYSADKVYPSPSEADNRHHQARLRAAFDDGQLVVHFLGHGGRYIWRTGPPDYRKNHDLFTLDDLDQLAANDRLPMVLAMSCYSAPFDHPTADSIGEKLFRLEGRGAVAVLAASWRNSPSVRFSRSVLEGLLAGQPIGEAVRQAKLSVRDRAMVETYNLLGDPALELALPRLPLTVMPERTAEGWRVEVRVDPERTVVRNLDGEGRVEWVDAVGNAVASVAAAVEDGRLIAHLDAEAAEAEPVRVRVHVWNEQRGLDGVGGAGLDGPEVAGAAPAPALPDRAAGGNAR